jgi:hypothetical protein
MTFLCHERDLVVPFSDECGQHVHDATNWGIDGSLFIFQCTEHVTVARKPTTHRSNWWHNELNMVIQMRHCSVVDSFNYYWNFNLITINSNFWKLLVIPQESLKDYPWGIFIYEGP